MPRYEMALILRVLPKVKIAQVLKRTADTILENNGILRSFQHLGSKTLPYRMKSHDGSKSEGVYVIVDFDSPISALNPISDHLKRDLDVIRPTILRKEEESRRPCHDGNGCDFGELTEESRRKVKQHLRENIRKL